MLRGNSPENECLDIEMGAQFSWELRTHFLPSSPFYMRESTE